MAFGEKEFLITCQVMTDEGMREIRAKVMAHTEQKAVNKLHKLEKGSYSYKYLGMHGYVKPAKYAISE